MASTAIVKTITDAMLVEIQDVLGSNYQQLPYVYDVSKNNFKQSMSKYGVRPLSSTEINGAVKATTHQHTFEVVLTEGYIDSSISDAKIQSTVLAMFENINNIYKRIEAVRAGVPTQVLNVTNITIQEPEILEVDKVVVLRASIDVYYRIEL